MALYGDLSSIEITDLLQWVENARKTGVLTVQSGKVSRRVVLDGGRIRACSSNDPSMLLGQGLLARGWIDERALREALAEQERTGETLGTILVNAGAVSSRQVIEAIHAKAEETIYALFDDQSASFRFDEQADIPENSIETDIRIQDVLLKGLQRYDEMKRIRELFPHRGVVLARSDRPIPDAVASSRVASRILHAIDGRRSIAEILLHARASAYLVSKFLFELHRKGLVRIVEIRSPETGTATPVPATSGSGRVGDTPAQQQTGLASEISVAEDLLAREEAAAALAVLHASARANPAVPTVRDMIARAESAWVETLRKKIPATSVPVQIGSLSGMDGDTVEPGEAYLLTLVDGRTDVRSLVWTVPMREVDVLRAVEGLTEKGCVRLANPV
jgi:hypothetical protein